MKHWTMVLAAGLAATGLGACAPVPQQKRAEPDIRAHCERLYADRALDPVRARIVLPIVIGAPQPVEMLAQRNHATDAEKPAVLALSRAFEACNVFAAERIGSLPAYRRNTNDRIVDALSDVYAGEMTYGQFARTLLYAGERDQVERQNLDEEIRQREKWRVLHDHNGN